MNETSRWPIDYDSLNKGDIIPVERCEEITGKRQGDSRYDLALLDLKDRIQGELHDRDKFWTLRTEKGAIKVLTDAEAYTYNHAEQVRARSAQVRRFALQSAVDVDKLSPDQRKEHERNVEVDGKYLQAMQGVRSQLRLSANKRNVPGLQQS